MKTIISITKRIERKNEETKVAKEKFLTLSDRLKEYTDFLVRQAPENDYEMWNEKLIKVLKFLGDYKVDNEV